MNYIETSSGRKIYGNQYLLKLGLDWVNLFGIILLIGFGYIIFGGKIW